MSFFERVRLGFEALFRRRELDRDLDDELGFHLEMEARELVRQGLSPQAARREARRRFGGVDKTKEECRDERGVGLADGLLQDLRYAARTLGRSPGFAAVAVVTLALGIGANTAIFSLVHGILLAPLPYPDGDRLVVLQGRAPEEGWAEWGSLPFSIPEVEDYRARLDGLSGLAEFHSMSFTLLGHGDPRRVVAGVVSTDFFDVLGVQPLHGRTFVAAADEPGAEAVLVVSHGFWQRFFHGDPHVVGQLFEMNDRPHRVVGVLPPVPLHPPGQDLYMPTSACPYRAEGARGARGNRSAFRNLHLVGRLAPGVDRPDLGTQASATAAGLVREFPDTYADAGYDVTGVALQDALVRDARPRLLILLGTVALVLLIACANVGSLMLARVLQRHRELTLRSAMGAGRGRLLRQLLVESSVLSLAGGVLGLVLARGALALLVPFFSRFTPRAAAVALDLPVLAFTFVLAVLTGIGCGALPGVLVRRGLLQALKSSGAPTSTAGRSTLRLRSALVVAQVAVSVVLLVAAGLMVRSLLALQSVDPGFRADNVVTAEMWANWSAYPEDEDEHRLYRTVLERLQGGPSVLAAAMAARTPLATQWNTPVEILVADRLASGQPAEGDAAEGRRAGGHTVDDHAARGHTSPDRAAGGQPPPAAEVTAVSGDYFRVLDTPILRGRGFTRQEQDRGAAVAVANEAFARSVWPGGDPLGRRVAPRPVPGEDPVFHTVVGVVADIRQEGLEAEPGPELFVPFTQRWMGGNVFIRSTAPPATVESFLREQVRAVAPEQAVANVRTLAQVRAAELWPPRVTTGLLSAFALVALLITVTGIGGVIATSVSQRQREFGVRMALGARRSDIVVAVLRQALALVLVGAAVGLAVAASVDGLFARFLYRFSPTDVSTYALVLAAVVAAAVVACVLPGRRAGSVDPVQALRQE